MSLKECSADSQLCSSSAYSSVSSSPVSVRLYTMHHAATETGSSSATDLRHSSHLNRVTNNSSQLS